MATLKFNTYFFNIPPQISLKDYETLKAILEEKPDFKLNPPSSFAKTFKVELVFLVIGALGFLLASLDIAEWLNWVGGIPAFFALFSLFSFVPSMVSYLDFLSDKARYYSRLKQDIVNSNNYNEFLILRNNRR